MNYSWTKIASVYLAADCIEDWKKITFQSTIFNSLSDATLDDIVSSIKYNHPNDGEIWMQVHLRRVGLEIERQDRPDSIH